jgi:hypothetical protein
MEQKQELEQSDDVQSNLFGPVIFLILTGLWFMLYFNLINFNSCYSNLSFQCIIVPLTAWLSWLISSLLFLILCIFKLIKERKLIDLLILIGYGSLYWFTIKFFFY